VKRKLWILLLAAAVALLGTPGLAGAQSVIAHRGASGYLPEHTLAGFAFAYAQGADFLLLDLMMSSDGFLIALHDRTLEATTDVAAVFPGRHRSDDRYYAADFSLPELRLLTVHERSRAGAAVYPGRFPPDYGLFSIPTVEEVILLVQGLNRSTGRDVGLYLDLQWTQWHRDQGLYMEEALLELLRLYGYKGPRANLYIQSAESSSLGFIRYTMNAEFSLIQRISEAEEHDFYATPEGLGEIAEYADGIAPSKYRIEGGSDHISEGMLLVQEAQALGLLVFPYTLRADRLSPYASSFDDELRRFFFQYGVDGVITDFPDHAVLLLQRTGAR